MGYSTKSCRFSPARTTYVSVGNYHAFERTNSFSVSCWAKWTATGLSYTMVGKMGDSPAFQGWSLRAITTGEIHVYFINDHATLNEISVQTTSTAFKDGAWHHIAMTYDGSSTAAGVKIYVDGNLQAVSVVTDALSATIVSTDELRLGARKTTGNETYFQGNLDEIAIYNAVLSVSDVTAIYNQGATNDLSLLGSAANLVGWWRMGDGDTYPTLTDYGSGGNNGTMTSMVAADIQTDAPFPRLMTLDHTNWRFKANLLQPYTRRCLVFTGGSSQYVDFGDVLGFERTATRSISFWAKWTSTQGVFISKQGDSGGSAYPGFMVLNNTSGQIEFMLSSNFGTSNYLHVRTTSAYNSGAWRHIVITYDGSSTVAGVTFYVDGASVAKTTILDALSASILGTDSLQIGARAIAASRLYYTGSMDEISIYDSALSAAQVTALYNGKCPTNLLKMVSPAPAGLLGWWRMGDGDTAPTITDNSTGGNNGTMTNSPVITADWPTTGVYDTDYKILWRNIKNALIDGTGWTDSTGAAATLTTPWTVVASSNGTVANTSDNWTTNADIVFAPPPTAHSWIVLRQTGLISGQNFEMCIDLKDSATYDVSVAVSFGLGFDVSSPVTTARPTAKDEYFWLSNQNWFNSAASFNTVLNVCVTDDGQCTRFWGTVAGAAKTFWAIDRPKNTATGWANPVIGWMASGSGPLCSSFNDNAWTIGRISGTNVGFYLTAEFYVDGCVIQRSPAVNQLSNEYPINRIGLACTTPGFYGRHGEVSDLWWISTTPVVGDTTPATGTLKRFIVIPNMIHPWNQSVPVLT